MRLGVRLRTQSVNRPRPPSRLPAVKTQPHYAEPAECFLCGAPIWPGDEALSRAYDVRVSCVTCPWPASAISERTR